MQLILNWLTRLCLYRLIQNNPGRYRNIQRFNLSEHRDFGQMIGNADDFVADAIFFRSHDDGGWRGIIRCINIFFGFFGTANQLQARFLQKRMVCIKLSCRQTGILYNAPAEVLIASALICAEPFAGITMACTPAHSAVRAMAPMLRTSVMPSSTRISGTSPFSNISGMIFSIF